MNLFRTRSARRKSAISIRLYNTLHTFGRNLHNFSIIYNEVEVTTVVVDMLYTLYKRTFFSTTYYYTVSTI